MLYGFVLVALKIKFGIVKSMSIQNKSSYKIFEKLASVPHFCEDIKANLLSKIPAAQLIEFKKALFDKKITNTTHDFVMHGS